MCRDFFIEKSNTFLLTRNRGCNEEEKEKEECIY